MLIGDIGRPPQSLSCMDCTDHGCSHLAVIRSSTSTEGGSAAPLVTQHRRQTSSIEHSYSGLESRVSSLRKLRLFAYTMCLQIPTCRLHRPPMTPQLCRLASLSTDNRLPACFGRTRICQPPRTLVPFCRDTTSRQLGGASHSTPKKTEKKTGKTQSYLFLVCR